MKPLKNILIGIGILVTITIIAMAAAPNVTVTYPTNVGETVNGTITVSADANDDDGNITNVSFYYSNDSGTNWYFIYNNETTNLTTYSYAWNTTTVSDGSNYIIRATATDNSSETASDTSNNTFTVQNTEAPGKPNVTGKNPTTDHPNGVPQEFSVRFNQTVDVIWKINGTLVPNNSTVTAGTWANYTNSTAGVGSYEVSAIGTNTTTELSGYCNWTWTVSDSTPPESITNLTVFDRDMTWINWTWDNPEDTDFDHVEVWLDDVNTTTTQYEFHNATNLAPYTEHTIDIFTVDDAGIKNTTAVNDTNTTLPNTPKDTDVTLDFGKVIIVFSNVTDAGNTTVIETRTNPGGSHNFTAVSKYYDINTTANYSGTVNISFPYNEAGITKSLVRLYHWNVTTSAWEDTTTVVDQTNNKVSGEVTSLSPFVAGVPAPMGIDNFEPDNSEPENVEGETRTFSITMNQIANIVWEINGSTVNTTPSALTSSVDLSNSSGNYNITVTATNLTSTSSASKRWNWTVHHKFYNTGNRIWAADMGLNNTYTWTAQSFSGFFYDIDNNVKSETMTITLAPGTNNIDNGKLVYESKPVNIKYEHDAWGNYTAIGFLAAKYFAGYTDNSVVKKEDMVSRGYLSKVLIDEDEKHTITIGSTLPLEEGYVLKAIDISVDDSIVRFVLLKDGKEVSGSHDIVNDKDEFVYEKQIGSVKDVPIIIVYVDTVFHGRETDMVQIKGVFQISDSPTKIEDGDTYGIMEVTGTSGGIKMENDDSFDLSRDSTVEIMGDIKFKVADSDILRFAPFVEGLEELRGTVSCSEAAFDWTPFNFEGLYYDFDTGLWSETLKVISADDHDIDKNYLVYESKPINTEFEHDDWGMYDLIGFMAEKYFAAYNNTSQEIINSNKDLLSKGYLSKVLIDEDKKHTITIGSTLPLEEGYVLKAIDISVDDSIVRFVLLKDGKEVSGSHDIVNDKDEFVYEKQIGSVKDVPIIIVYVDTVFHGRETDMVQIKGVFQISENPIELDSGDEYGIMEVTSTSHGIEMKNKEETISLGAGDTIDVMGEIRFKVADSDELRYYPFITVDVEAEAASKLGITAPDTASKRDTITIGITAGGESIAGSDVEFDGENIGITDANGEVLYELTSAGNFTINATKLGYESASKTITVEEYSETQLRIESVSELLQTDTFELTVTAGETPLSGVDVFVDDNPVGVTDTDGIFS